MSTQKHPVRTCIVCGLKKNKEEFIRFVLMDGKIKIDKRKCSEGRGAYVCKKIDCLKSLSKRYLEKSFRKKVVFNEEIKKQLQMECING